MNDWEVVELAFDILNDADVVEEFEDSVWLKVDRELWEKFINKEKA
jgi:hypothetical protein